MNADSSTSRQGLTSHENLDLVPSKLTSASDVHQVVWHETVSLLERGGLSPSWVQLVRDGEVEPPSAVCTAVTVAGRPVQVIDPGILAAIEQMRHTLVISGLDRLTTSGAEWCEAEASSAGGSFDLNAYLTPAGTRGFNLHYDPQDVYLFQLDGSKTWSLFEPDFKLPGPGDHSKGRYINYPTEPSFVMHLEPTEVLYIPRGWGHQGVTGEAWSIHLTLGHIVETVATALFGVSPTEQVDREKAESDLRRNARALRLGELEQLRDICGR